MTPDQRFAIIIAALSFLFVIISTSLGLIIRVTVKWTRTEDKLAELVRTTDATYNKLATQVQEDRKATNERLTYLERSVWPIQTRRRNPG